VIGGKGREGGSARCGRGGDPGGVEEGGGRRGGRTTRRGGGRSVFDGGGGGGDGGQHGLDGLGDGDAVGEGVASSSSGSEEASDSEEATISGAASSLALDPMTEAPPLPQPFKETSSVPSAGALVSTSAVELMDESRSEHNHERVDAVGEIGRS